MSKHLMCRVIFNLFSAYIASIQLIFYGTFMMQIHATNGLKRSYWRRRAATFCVKHETQSVIQQSNRFHLLDTISFSNLLTSTIHFTPNLFKRFKAYKITLDILSSSPLQI